MKTLVKLLGYMGIGAFVILFAGACVAIIFALPAGLAWLLSYVLAAFGVSVGFWPCFALVVLVLVLASAFRGGKS